MEMTAASDFTTFVQQWDQNHNEDVMDMNEDEVCRAKRTTEDADVGSNHFECDYCGEECYGEEHHMPNPRHALPNFDDLCPNPECDFVFPYMAEESEPFCPKCCVEFPMGNPMGSFCSEECKKACAMYEVGGIVGSEMATLIDQMAGMKVQEAAPWTQLEIVRNDGTGLTREDWNHNMVTKDTTTLADGSERSKKKKEAGHQ